MVLLDMPRRRGPAIWRRRDAIPPLAGLLGLLCCSEPAPAGPFVPADDGIVLERLPTAKDPRVAELRRGHAALARAPNNIALAVAVARRDISEARARFDPRFNGYAQAALAPWWGLAEPPAQVRLLRAVINQSNHDFPAALTDLDALIRARPDDAQALLTRAVVHQVRAEYAAAAADCAAVERAGAALAAGICASGVRGLGRDAAAAERELAELVDPAAEPAAPALRLWALTVLAEMAARRGDANAAEARFQTSRALDPDDAYLLGAYADFLLDQDRPREVVDLLAEQTRIDPLLLRLAIAEQRLGLPAASGHIADLNERFAASTARGETVHNREQARFTLVLLEQPSAALRLAAANWEVQREPADARILLECAVAAAAPDAARPVVDWLEATGLSDAALGRLTALLVARKAAS